MMSNTGALIASFVVRLMKDGEEGPLRVTVRHVQSGSESRFLRLTDALEFMEAYAQEPSGAGKTDEEMNAR